MRYLSHRLALAGTVIIGLATGAPSAGSADSTAGGVEQSVPPTVSQHPSIPPLHLSADQRTKVQQALSSEDTEVSFALKQAKAEASFQPSTGATIPKGLKPLALPQPLVQQIPLLKRYAYLKFKHQVLIVDPMTRKVVDIFPET